MELKIRFASDKDLDLIRQVEHYRFVVEENEMTEEEFQQQRPRSFYSLRQCFVLLGFVGTKDESELAVMLGGREPNNPYFKEGYGHWLNERERQIGGEISFSYTAKKYRKLGLQLLLANITNVLLWAKGARLYVAKMRFKPHWKDFGPHFNKKIGKPEVRGPAKHLYQDMIADLKEQFVCSACVLVKQFCDQGYVKLAEICREKATVEAVEDVMRLLQGQGEKGGVGELRAILQRYYDVELSNQPVKKPNVQLRFEQQTEEEMAAIMSAAEAATYVVLPSWL